MKLQLQNANLRCCECGKPTKNVGKIGGSLVRICKGCIPVRTKRMLKK